MAVRQKWRLQELCTNGPPRHDSVYPPCTGPCTKSLYQVRLPCGRFGYVAVQLSLYHVLVPMSLYQVLLPVRLPRLASRRLGGPLQVQPFMSHSHIYIYIYIYTTCYKTKSKSPSLREFACASSLRKPLRGFCLREYIFCALCLCKPLREFLALVLCASGCPCASCLRECLRESMF